MATVLWTIVSILGVALLVLVASAWKDLFPAPPEKTEQTERQLR